MFFLFFLLVPIYANAYLDLGSGSYFLQMFLALLFTVLVSIHAFWYKIVSLFRKIRKKDGKKKDGEEKPHEDN